MFPKYREVERPLLFELVRRGGEAAPGDEDERGRSVYAALADEFDLSAEERDERTTGDGEGRVRWEKMVRWARQKLVDDGLLASPRRGVWQVTTAGRESLRAAGDEGATRLPEEVAAPARFAEGACRRITVNAYERDPRARRLCLETHGTACCVCGFRFGPVYGPDADGFIHVHHLRPLSEVDRGYSIDPAEDLRPVCPNCHAFLHMGGRCRTVEEARKAVRDNRGRT